MKHSLFVAILVIMLAGCATPPGGANPLATALSNQADRLADVTAADLDDAIAVGQNNVPPDTQAVTCFSFVKNHLPDLKAAAMASLQPAGPITRFEMTHLAVGALRSGLPATQRAALENACGPYVMNVVGDVNFAALALGRVVAMGIPAIKP